MHWWRCHWISNWHNIRRMGMDSMRKHHWSANRGCHVPRRSCHWMPNRCPVHAYSRQMLLRPVLPWWPQSRWITLVRAICLVAGDWSLMGHDIATAAIIYWGYVMNTWSSSISVHWVQSYEILLCVTSHLCRCPGYNKVSWNASPIPFAKFV